MKNFEAPLNTRVPLKSASVYTDTDFYPESSLAKFIE